MLVHGCSSLRISIRSSQGITQTKPTRIGELLQPLTRAYDLCWNKVAYIIGI